MANIQTSFAWMTAVAAAMALWAGQAAAADSPAAGAAVKADSVRAYIGTYTQKSAKGITSQGIYMMNLNLADGTLSTPELAGEAVNPSFLALHPTGKFLYAVGEAGGKGGTVSAFAIDASTGKLKLLNQQSSAGGGPCHVNVDKAGKNALTANYGSGSFGVLPIGPDGQLAEPSCKIQDEGSGPNAARQKGPHAHSINLDPAGRFAFGCDLGLDKVFIWKFDADKGTLTPNDPPAAAVAPGAGPRHLAFHPNGKFVYLINEMASTITVFAYDGAGGKMTELQTITTLPADFKGNNTTAEVQVHPSGKFVYGSNRGHNSIAVFSCDQATGKLTFVQHQPSGGKTPRGFGIDPSGAFLLAAHQDSDNIVAFKIDPASGQLKPTGSSVEVGKPVCVKFYVPVK